MFENIGAKIMGLATIISIFGITGSIVVGFGVMFSSGNTDEASAGVGFGIMIIGSLISWVGGFLLYGFGELIEQTTVNAEATRELLNLYKKEMKDQVSEENKSSASPVINETIKIEKSNIPVKVHKNNDGKIICPACGHEQEGHRLVCFECGQKFINGQANIPYWCGRCGKEGPYLGDCPDCGSSITLYNN